MIIAVVKQLNQVDGEPVVFSQYQIEIIPNRGRFAIAMQQQVIIFSVIRSLGRHFHVVGCLSYFVVKIDVSIE